MTEERKLHGGRTTWGVVRIGQTVRRPRSPNATFVRRLLRHLEAVGFDGAPRILGTDDKGRDILTFIEGEVPAELGDHADDVLAAAARLIRRYHDATAGLAAALGQAVVCHNDLSPCNFVFRDGRPVAIIDFDAAAPGARAHDLGYAAWLWLDLGNADVDPDRQRDRLRAFIGAYDGALAIPPVIAAMLQRQHHLAEAARLCGDAAMAEWAARCLDWTSRHLAAQGGSESGDVL